MNDRIKELAKQSGVYFGEESIDYFGDYYPAFVTTDKMNIEKFVNLIVKECAKIADRADVEGCECIGDNIKFQMGIKS